MNDPSQPAAQMSVKHTLLEKVAVPALFVAIGYALGFFHGNTRGKRKSSAPAA